MDSNTKPNLTFEIPGVIQVYKDGRVERLIGGDFVPPSTDPSTGVTSKDVTIFPESNISARFYLPKLTHPNQKSPLLVYFHDSGFCVLSPFTHATFNNYLNKLVAEANVVAVSVDYRKAPEHPIPAAYKDSWAALQWVVAHSAGDGPEQWLNEHADFGRVFSAGESAGGTLLIIWPWLQGPRYWARSWASRGCFDPPVVLGCGSCRVGRVGS
ncbi:hypothetical protein Tsubulata_010580 [Turnera subulata]|uniref:Alpha/beta hydrolase fold-3 domain-containing protein n=1 Tax=Turnera subulata TaxID=218843 RepID=A0A9Q0G8W5_9ROSI|nr:hypothetical protein Tsubulata_010580 [Turnera subulata]